MPSFSKKMAHTVFTADTVLNNIDLLYSSQQLFDTHTSSSLIRVDGTHTHTLFTHNSHTRYKTKSVEIDK